MSKHKKTKQLANKKQKGKKGKQKNKNNNAKTPSLEELLQAGDAALLAMEGDKAMAFFTSALSVLDQQQQQQSTDEQTNHNNRDKLVYVLEKLGELKASEGNSVEAKQDFERAIGVMTNTTKQQQQQQPQQDQSQDTAQYQETLAGLHLYIGQLSCEQEALEAYKKGLECLEHSLKIREQQAANNASNTAGEVAAAASMDVDTTEEEEQNSPQAALKEVRQKLASARVTVAELYLTDLCYDENAEQQCEHYVQLALEIQDPDDDTNEPCMVDALQTAASLKLSQQQTQSARTYILRAYQKIKVGCEALSQLGGIASSNNKQQKKAVELLEVDAAEGLPSFDFRCQTAKLLLECSAGGGDNDENNSTTERAQCNAAAIQVLGSLLAENDEVPDIYYLLGCAYHGEGNADLAQHYWSKAMQMLESIQQDMEQQQAEAAEEGDMQVEDEEENDEMELQIQAISCQIEEIKSKLEDLEESSGGGSSGGGKPKAAPKADDDDDDEMEE